ncbi:MAG: hypothetical protein WBQ43_19960 [Terriglobales bacterium]
MKLKSLLVITLSVAACSFASAQTFGFLSIGGDKFCNYEQLSSAGGNNYVGVDNLSVCGYSTNATISGFGAKLPPTTTDYGYTIKGDGVIYGDSIYAVAEDDPYAQFTIFTRLECNTYKNGHIKGPLSFVAIAAFSGVYVGNNQGFLSCVIPGKNGDVPTLGTTALTKAEFQRKK